MDEPIKKRVDESWKEQAEREKHAAEAAAAAPGRAEPLAGEAVPERAQRSDQPAAPKRVERPDAGAPGAEELPQAQFDLFLSGLAMETLIALGEMPHPATRRQGTNLPQAKYLIDLLGLLEEKTKGNLTVEEDKLFKDTLYQLRMRYLSKSGGV